jgi:hypothetical protein
MDMIIRGLKVKRGRLVEAGDNKFGAKRTAGFDSGGECAYAAYLDTLVIAKQIRGYRRQVTVPIDIRDDHGRVHHICSMRVDFLVEHNGKMAADGELEWIEFKGFATPEWLLKKKLFEAVYPDRKYTVIYARGGKGNFAPRIKQKRA